MHITPTIGRIVYFYDDAQQKQSTAQPFAAQICYVHSAGMVNLSVTDYNGNIFPRTSVPLIQPDETPPTHGYFCEWMNYQVQQAKRQEQNSGA